MQTALELGQSHGSKLKALLRRSSIKPYAGKDLAMALESPLRFVRPGRGGKLAVGYEATILPDICSDRNPSRNRGLESTGKFGSTGTTRQWSYRKMRPNKLILALDYDYEASYNTAMRALFPLTHFRFLYCNKCAYAWRPRLATFPAECPQCKSRTWRIADKSRPRGSAVIQMAIKRKFLPELSKGEGIKCAYCHRRAVRYFWGEYTEPMRVKPVCAEGAAQHGPVEPFEK